MIRVSTYDEIEFNRGWLCVSNGQEWRYYFSVCRPFDVLVVWDGE